MRKKVWTLLLVCLIFVLAGCGKDTEPRRETIPLEQLDEETVQHTLEYVEDINVDLMPILSSYLDENGYVAPEDQEHALEDIYQYAQELCEHGQVTDCYYEPGATGVCVRIDGWLTVYYDVPMADVMTGGDDVPQIITLEPNATELSPAYLASDFEGPVEGAGEIFSQFSEFENVRTELDGRVSVESFKRTAKNSVLLYSGHGGWLPKYGPIICATIDESEKEMHAKYVDEFYDEALFMTGEQAAVI